MVVICTRNRPAQLQQALEALDRQDGPHLGILVVDQSDAPDAQLAQRAADDPRVTVLHDDGRGLSRARNLATAASACEWLVFVDDDCLPEPGWSRALVDAIAAHPEADLISGHVGAADRQHGDERPAYAVFPVAEERLVRGRWVWPHEIGFGVCVAVRRAAIERLGGWDERLGPGVPEFPASDDMDFNFRLLRGGGTALLTPTVRAHHAQWRGRDEVVALFAGYMASWAGFAVKHMRSGDRLAGVWLWSYGLRDAGRMLASAARHRSRLRLRIARAKLVGLVRGTRDGFRTSWQEPHGPSLGRPSSP